MSCWIKTQRQVSAPLQPGRSNVHTQPFAFRAPHEDDESVKISNTTAGRSSTLSPVPPPLRPVSSHLQNSQFLFDTNERFSLRPPSPNANNTKQSTSLVPCGPNERFSLHPNLATQTKRSTSLFSIPYKRTVAQISESAH